MEYYYRIDRVDRFGSLNWWSQGDVYDPYMTLGEIVEEEADEVIFDHDEDADITVATAAENGWTIDMEIDGRPAQIRVYEE